DRLAVGDQRSVHAQIKTPDQSAELRRLRAQAFTLHRHAWNFHRGAEAIHSCSPGFSQTAGWLEHGVIDLLEFHARAAHSDKRDEGCEHFVAAFADLVDARVAQ